MSMSMGLTLSDSFKGLSRISCATSHQTRASQPEGRTGTGAGQSPNRLCKRSRHGCGCVCTAGQQPHLHEADVDSALRLTNVVFPHRRTCEASSLLSAACAGVDGRLPGRLRALTSVKVVEQPESRPARVARPYCEHGSCARTGGKSTTRRKKGAQGRKNEGAHQETEEASHLKELRVCSLC